MNKNMKVSTTARHCYTQAYNDYLRTGDLEAATRQVAHDIYVSRGGKPGTPRGDWQEAERITREWAGTIAESSNAHVFDHAMAKAREWLKDVEGELELHNLNDAYRAMRAVLHAMRDRLPVNESAELAAQLPMLLMGMYYSGWTPKNKPEKMRTLDEFLDRVLADLPKGMDPMRVTLGIIKVLERRISQGELDGVRSNFPEGLREIWAETSGAAR
jgi:uncharacterized protein (DUF2267 family)